jgi:predicted NBD/HSP70 family sugar kinase
MDDNGEIIWRARKATPADSYDAILDTLETLICAADAHAGSTVNVGIGMPGSLSPKTGNIRNSNTQSLIGKPFREDMQNRLGREVRLANDANCFALSEAFDGAGAGAGANGVFGVILGTGCGGGLVINGKLQVGTNGIGGEWGHNPLAAPRADEVPGPLCYCGRKGCNEVWLSGTGLARDHYETTGEKLTAVEIAAQATPGTKASIERLSDRLARALGAVINLVDPDVIVLGGGLSNIDLFYSRVPELWANYIFSDVINTRLVPNKHGDASGVRGAAWLWPIGG